MSGFFPSFAHVVREARSETGLSQTEFAATLGRTQGWCSRIESGDRDPSLADLELLSHRFGVRLEDGRWDLSASVTPGTNV